MTLIAQVTVGILVLLFAAALILTGIALAFAAILLWLEVTA